jgi:hypothetical protein
MIAIKLAVFPDRTDDKVIDRHPHRPTPVAVAAKKVTGRIARVVLMVYFHHLYLRNKDLLSWYFDNALIPPTDKNSSSCNKRFNKKINLSFCTNDINISSHHHVLHWARNDFYFYGNSQTSSMRFLKSRTYQICSLSDRAHSKQTGQANNTLYAKAVKDPPATQSVS